MPATLNVRPETPADIGDVREVHRRAFAPSLVEADLVDALRASPAHVPELCLVAVRDEVIVGHVAFSRAHVGSGHPVLALAPMGVLPECQGQGVGSALAAEGLRRAAGTDFPLVVVLGHPAYYPRFGFEPADALGVSAPFAVPAEAWMVYRLPAYRSDARGTVAYSDAFPEST